MCKLILYMAAFMCCFSLFTTAQSSSSFSRDYVPGETYRYRLTTNVSHNGKWQSRIIAVCELKVVKDNNGVPADELHWISKKVLSQKDTADLSSDAIRVKPYRISLHPEGKLDLPEITVPDMTGEITDLNTFFVAVAPVSGVQYLNRKGDHYTKPEPVRGNFTNGEDIIVGDDCIQMTVSMLEDTNDSVVIQTGFQPPDNPCLHYLLDDIHIPVVKNNLNNFQMVRRSSNGKVNILFGKEVFDIITTLQKRDGKIIRAAMSNTLTLKLKLNCNTDYTGCQGEFPFVIQRDLLLELMDH